MKKIIAFGSLIIIAAVVWTAVANAGNVVKIIKEGSPPKYEETKFNAIIKDYYYRAAVIGEGLGKPVMGNVGEFVIEGIKLTMKDKSFNDGAIMTEELGSVRILFSSSLYTSGFVCLLTKEQIKELEKLVDKNK